MIYDTPINSEMDLLRSVKHPVFSDMSVTPCRVGVVRAYMDYVYAHAFLWYYGSSGCSVPPLHVCARHSETPLIWEH
ncbi:hypothetical protein TNCV_1327051 [Trichonephila clavipes]|nr:hypothetical protein TNCV_1327051 [Trichonephila clavipes]